MLQLHLLLNSSSIVLIYSLPFCQTNRNLEIIGLVKYKHDFYCEIYLVLLQL